MSHEFHTHDSFESCDIFYDLWLDKKDFTSWLGMSHDRYGRKGDESSRLGLWEDQRYKYGAGRTDRRIFTQPSKYFSYYKILQYDSIIYLCVLLLEVSKLLRYDQQVKFVIWGQIITVTARDITSPSKVERDYEIILDKISRLSLREDLTVDNPIVETISRYYLISNKIVRRYQEVIVS